MSVITNLYAQLNTTLPTLFSTHKKMVDPQNVENNDNFILNKGYGFYIGPSTNTNRLINCKYSISRNVTIVLTRSNKGTDRDTTIRETAELALLEDQHILVKAMEADVDLNQVVASFKYTSDNGVEYLNVNSHGFLVCRISFDAEYLESLS